MLVHLIRHSFTSHRVYSNWVLHIPSSTTNLGEGELDTPDLTLVAETVLADSLQFGVTIEDMLGMDNTT